jgi:nitrate/nitrite-specific signal transduction histidine kinase
MVVVMSVIMFVTMIVIVIMIMLMFMFMNVFTVIGMSTARVVYPDTVLVSASAGFAHGLSILIFPKLRDHD